MRFSYELALEKASELPPSVALYGVFKNEELLYIGSSTCLRRRFKAHLRAEKFELSCIVKWNEYNDTDGEKLNKDERDAILKFNPPMNKSKSGATKARKNWGMYGKKARDRSVLHQATYDLLWHKIEASISKLHVLETAAQKTGLSYSWLEKFAQDNGGSPAVERLETLYAYLAGKKLEIGAK